jgi:hypothetical protein
MQRVQLSIAAACTMVLACKMVQLVLVVASLFSWSAYAAMHKSIDVNPEVRAQQTIEGLFNYYWKQDPMHKDISFFFSCGEIGNLGVSNLDQCSCQYPSTCVNCYRWWSAVALESIVTYGIYMNTSNHSSVSDMIFDHSAYNSNWQPENAFIDDFLWYGITYLRVYEWLKVQSSGRMWQVQYSNFLAQCQFWSVSVC